MAKIEGTLRLTQTDAGNFLSVFTPNGYEAKGKSRPLLTKDSGAVETDLVNLFELTVPNAQLFIADAIRNGDAGKDVSIDEGLATKLVENSD